jgi:hypothetical protein
MMKNVHFSREIISVFKTVLITDYHFSSGNQNVNHNSKKSKAIPLTGHGGPYRRMIHLFYLMLTFP